MQDLKVSLVQSELQWESPVDNRAHFTQLLRAQETSADLYVLPEMFTTGFSMNALANAEAPQGDTYQWLQAMAVELSAAVAGSVAIRDGGAVFNRLLLQRPIMCITTISDTCSEWRESTSAMRPELSGSLSSGGNGELSSKFVTTFDSLFLAGIDRITTYSCMWRIGLHADRFIGERFFPHVRLRTWPVLWVLTALEQMQTA